MLPEGITGETTVRELLEKDRAFFDENLGTYRVPSILMTAFVPVFFVIFLCLALAWRRAEPFGRTTLIGLRWLGGLLVLRFFVAWSIDLFFPGRHSVNCFSTAIPMRSQSTRSAAVARSSHPESCSSS